MTSQRKFSKSPRHRRGLRLGSLLTALILAAGTWLLFFLNSERFSLRLVEIRGEKRLNEQTLAQAIDEALVGRRWLVFRRRSFWFYSAAETRSALLNRFTRLVEVETTARGFKTLRLEVKERAPVALWCPEPAICFYLDETGLAFARAPFFSSPPLLVLNGFWRGAPRVVAGPGSQPWPRPVFDELLALAAGLQNFFRRSPADGDTVRQIDVDAAGDYQFYLADYRRTPSGFRIIVGPGAPAAEILAALESVFALPTFQAELTVGRKLQYLDFRFRGKVFYRII